MMIPRTTIKRGIDLILRFVFDKAKIKIPTRGENISRQKDRSDRLIALLA